MTGIEIVGVSFGPTVLSLPEITGELRSTFDQLTDPRRGKNT
jgi:hypothetical protein